MPENPSSIPHTRRTSGKILSGRVYPEFFQLSPTDRVANLGCGEGPQAIIYDGQFKEMVGIDVNQERLERSEARLAELGVEGYSTLACNVEDIPLPDASFDKVIAVDIIEHVEHPERVCAEAYRLLVDGGRMLMTFPAMHDKYVHSLSAIKRVVLRRPPHEHSHDWNPDEHNQDRPVSEWLDLVKQSGFELKNTRATTMFPPLHRYGVPRFWFSNNTIHALDRQICTVPGLNA
jgi:cyclopropane fatty-acyl-phospholipid synthase-like methyltransferase